MADVVVNITGDASGLQNTLDQFGQQNSPQIPLGGNNSGDGRQTPQPPMPSGQTPLPQTPGGGTPAMPTYDRMAQDIRREITNRGVMMVPGTANFNQFMNQVQQQQKNNAYRAIDAKYDDRFNQLQTRRREEEDSLRKEIEERRNAALAGKTSPLAIKNINDSFDASLSRRLNRLDSKYELEYQKLEKSSSSERASVDKELIKVIEDLTQELKRSGSNDSYLGKLRNQHREALSRRENAMTEEEVRKASRDAADIELKISKAMGNYNPMNMIGRKWGMIAGMGGVGLEAFRHYIGNTGKKIDVLGTAANGDAFGAMQQELDRQRGNWAAGGGAGLGTILGAVGAIFSGGTAAAGGATIGSGMGSWLGSAAFDLFYADEINRAKFGGMWSQHEKQMSAFNDLAMLTKSMWTPSSIDTIRGSILNLFAMNTSSGNFFKTMRGSATGRSLGYTADQASQIAYRYLSARGHANYSRVLQNDILLGIDDEEERRRISSKWSSVTAGVGLALEADALEKVFNMSSGSLAQLSVYDRYGDKNDANRDFVNLYESLSKRGTLGMSNGFKMRSNEFLSYQMQLLEGQKSWMMNPSNRLASSQLLAAQDVYGNSLDSRGIQAIQRMNDAVTNPQDEMVKVLTYDVIQQLFPETRGNMMAITQKQFSDDPNVRAKIQQGIFKKITETYGEADTYSGYSALSYYTGIKNPTELLGWSKRMQAGLPTPEVNGDVGSYVNETHGYTTKTQEEMIKFTDETIQKVRTTLGNIDNVAQYLLNDFRDQINEIAEDIRDSLN